MTVHSDSHNWFSFYHNMEYIYKSGQVILQCSICIQCIHKNDTYFFPLLTDISCMKHRQKVFARLRN